VSAAVRFIRDHACERIDVGGVLKAGPISRTLLVGCTPTEYRTQHRPQAKR